MHRGQQFDEPLKAGPNSGPCAHVCVAGAACSDWEMVDALGGCGQVTLVRDVESLWPGGLLSTVAVLAVDLGADVNGGLALVSLLADRHPTLRIVVINGRLSQSEIAEAFRRGACDYFASSSCKGLVVERLISLSRRRAVRRRN